MRPRLLRKINNFKLGDLVVFVRDKTNQIFRVDYVMDDYCNIKYAKTNNSWGWVNFNKLKLLSAIKNHRKRR